MEKSATKSSSKLSKDGSDHKGDSLDSSDIDYYNKFYNLLYEDDNFKHFKESLELETRKFESDFQAEATYKNDKNSLSLQITQCLADIQRWKEERKSKQADYESKIKEMVAQDDSEAQKVSLMTYGVVVFQILQIV